MVTLTKTANQVFQPLSGGLPRGADMGEAQTWGTEVEAAIAAVEIGLAGVSTPVFSLAGVVSVTGNATLTSASYGKLVKFTGSTASTITLLTLSGSGDTGKLITILNSGSANVVISGATALQTISPDEDGGTSQTITLRPGDRAQLMVEGTLWNVTVISKRYGSSAGQAVRVASDGYLPALDGRRLVNLPVTTQTQRTVYALGGGTRCGAAVAGAVMILSDGWAYACGKSPFNGSNLAQNPFFQPLRLTPGEVAPTLPFVKAVKSLSCIYLLDSVGSVYCLGSNTSGQLGQGDTIVRLSLVRMSWFVTNSIVVTDVIVSNTGHAGDSNETVYFIGNATGVTQGVWAVGRHDAGQLGDGSTMNSTPRTVPVRCSTITNIVKLVATGSYNGSVLALKNDGTLYFWGYNGYGISGDGATVNKNSPMTSINGVADFDITTNNAGGWYTTAMAVMTNGTIRGIGYNGIGQFGNGNTTNSIGTWVSPSLSFSNPSKIVLCGGAVHSTSAIITTDGRLKLAGRNNVGQLGNGNTTDQSTFSEPSFAAQSTVADVIFAGEQNNVSIMVRDSVGIIWSAGYGTNGGLASAQSNVPASQTSYLKAPLPNGELASSLVAVAAGGTNLAHFFVKSTTNQLYAAGWNQYGGLGLGHYENIVDAFQLVRL